MAGSTSCDTLNELEHYDLTGRKIARIYVMDSYNGKPIPEMNNEKHIVELTEALKISGFEVDTRKNLEEDHLKKDLKSVAQGTEELACLWVFIFASGNSEFIPCFKGVVTFKELWAPFSGEKCPILLGKPKMFFVQADVKERDDTVMPLMNIVSRQPRDHKVLKTLPASADIMVAMFKRKGMDRKQSIGRIISEELSKQPQNMYQMMCSILGRGWRHTPRFSSTFSKQLYLPPKSESADPVTTTVAETPLERYTTTGKRVAYSFVFRKFVNLYELPGADADKEAIAKAMEKRGFSYEDCNKDWTLTASAMKEKLEEIAENKENADCVIIFVSSHGTMANEIYAYDKKLKISELWTPFTATDGFKGKPKIFVIDACRGLSGDKGQKVYVVKVDPNDKDSETSMELLEQQQAPSDAQLDDGPSSVPVDDEAMSDEIPNDLHMLIGQSTVHGNIALQERCGSPYLQKLCRTLTDHNGNLNIMDVMTSANSSISEMTMEMENKTVRQMPVVTSTMSKIFLIN